MTELRQAASRETRFGPVPWITPAGVLASAERIGVGSSARPALALRRSPAVAGTVPGVAQPTSSGA